MKKEAIVNSHFFIAWTLYLFKCIYFIAFIYLLFDGGLVAV